MTNMVSPNIAAWWLRRGDHMLYAFHLPGACDVLPHASPASDDPCSAATRMLESLSGAEVLGVDVHELKLKVGDLVLVC